MENLNSDIKNKIELYLKEKKHGASSSEIAKYVGHNRVTITKYLEIMKAHNLLESEDIAQARIWRLKQMQKQKVLIVDDEPHVINLIKLSLMSSNYELFEACSGIDALQKINMISPDLIVLDLMMPGMTGYEVCKRIKENALTQHIQVIMLTAKGEIDDKIKGITHHADDYMTKPFDPMELEARIHIMLKYKEHLSEKHPITNLPMKGAIIEDLHNRMNAGRDFIMYSFVLDKFKSYSESFGYKKANDVLVLLARLMRNKTKGADFLGQTIKNNYVIISDDNTLDTQIIDSFAQMIPYFYEEDNPNGSLNLNVVKITKQDIAENKIDNFIPIV